MPRSCVGRSLPSWHWKSVGSWWWAHSPSENGRMLFGCYQTTTSVTWWKVVQMLESLHSVKVLHSGFGLAWQSNYKWTWMSSKSYTSDSDIVIGASAQNPIQIGFNYSICFFPRMKQQHRQHSQPLSQSWLSVDQGGRAGTGGRHLSIPEISGSVVAWCWAFVAFDVFLFLFFWPL